MALAEKLQELKKKSIKKGKLHWQENKVQCMEKGKYVTDYIKKKIPK